MHAMHAWRKHSRPLAVAGMLAVMLGAFVASAEVCTTPTLSTNKGTEVACIFTNAFAYVGVTVTIKLFDGTTGTVTAKPFTTPVAALGTASLTSGAC